jgi:hypothetical protein
MIKMIFIDCRIERQREAMGFEKGGTTPLKGPARYFYGLCKYLQCDTSTKKFVFLP